MARGGVRTAEAHTGAVDAGADDNKVAASAERRAYAVARRAPTARAATPAVRRAVVPTTKAHGEGADGDLASLAARERVRRGGRPQ